MKRLLLIAYRFPPAPSPGAQRPGYLARYLPEFGWNVTTLTEAYAEKIEAPPFPADVLHVRPLGWKLQPQLRSRVVASAGHPTSALRVALRRIKETILFPDAAAPWLATSVKAGHEALCAQRYDAILSTAMPASAHVIGWILARRHKLPWIADYRDPWAGNVYDPGGPVRKFLARFLERGVIHHAAAVTTTLDGFAAQIGHFNRRSVQVIPNAYDPADWAAIPNAEPQRFDLSFTGTMYDGKRTPDLLFEAIAQLRAEHDPAGEAARVHFYGRNLLNIAPAAARHGVSLLVRQYGEVSRAEAMRAQRAAAALLIFLNMDPATGHEMGSKYLEYIGARRPIIAFGPRNSIMRGFLAKHRLGWFASNVEEAKDALRGAYARFRSGDFQVSVDRQDMITARELAAEFAHILDAITGCDESRTETISQMRNAL